MYQRLPSRDVSSQASNVSLPRTTGKAKLNYSENLKFRIIRQFHIVFVLGNDLEFSMISVYSSENICSSIYLPSTSSRWRLPPKSK